MATRSTIRALVRGALRDTGGTQLWTDTEINDHILDAIRVLSDALPREKVQLVTSVADQASYNLAADVLRVARVEYPAGVFRRPLRFSGGDLSSTAAPISVPDWEYDTRYTFDVWGASGSSALVLWLDPAPTVSSETITVRYLGSYVEPANDSTTLDVAVLDESLLVLRTCQTLLEQIGLDESKRQRFERQRGSSPVTAAAQFGRRYRDSVQSRARSRMPARRLVRRD